MKIAGLQRLSLSDYPGVPAAVIFLQGCNLNCSFCHNRSLIPMEMGKPGMASEEILRYLEDRKGQIGGVVISGGEPTVHEELYGFLTRLALLGVKIKLDTNGTRPEYLQNIIEDGLVDYVAMDIKAPWEKYALLAGVGIVVDDVKKSMNFIARCGIKHHFRTTKVDHLLALEDMENIRKQIPKGSDYIIQKYKMVSNLAGKEKQRGTEKSELCRGHQ